MVSSYSGDEQLTLLGVLFGLPATAKEMKTARYDYNKCECVWIYVWMYVWLYVCLNVFMYVCMYVCLNVFMYVCMFVWVYALCMYKLCFYVFIKMKMITMTMMVLPPTVNEGGSIFHNCLYAMSYYLLSQSSLPSSSRRYVSLLLSLHVWSSNWNFANWYWNE